MSNDLGVNTGKKQKKESDTSIHNIWQDREIRFDVSLAALELRRGEFQIDTMDSVEDTKGNNGERGELAITNLRLIWCSHKNRKTNLSVGYNAVISINIRSASSRLRGSTQALYVLTKFNGSRFEFVFTNLVRNSPRLFTTIQAVFRAYDTTKLYRDLKLRGAIIQDKELILLPNEQSYNKVHGVWNLSSDQGNLGTFFVTNVRLVWHANMAENFNVSMPYLQMKSIRIRDSKFGPALVVETTQRSGGYILGFRVDPQERMQEIFKEVHALWQVFSVNPVFGIEYSLEDRPQPLQAVQVQRQEDDIEIVDQDEESQDVFAAYFADGAKHADRDPVFSQELGLAVEGLREGLTMEQLWSVL
mmetsp:Transcript_64068/g.202683  ORF Transcript_64068/g.202683 Transcript_64068/m.202683 type:complete len:360 (-) Transcript_64068:248-1327(-)